jgi:hypothetical protein
MSGINGSGKGADSRSCMGIQSWLEHFPDEVLLAHAAAALVVAMEADGPLPGPIASIVTRY